jgi:hypothetical protein
MLMIVGTAREEISLPTGTVVIFKNWFWAWGTGAPPFPTSWGLPGGSLGINGPPKGAGPRTVRFFLFFPRQEYHKNRRDRTIHPKRGCGAKGFSGLF